MAGRVFFDPLAARILGGDPQELVADARAHPDRRRMRLFIASRHRYAVDVGYRLVTRVTTLVSARMSEAAESGSRTINAATM